MELADLGVHTGGMVISDPISDFVRNSRKEKERASVDLKKEIGDAGFHLRAKGGKRTISGLIKALNEAL